MKKKYRVTLSERQRIGVLAALHYWKVCGCPLRDDFKRTHQMSGDDVDAIARKLHEASGTALDVVLTLDGGVIQSVDAAFPEDLSVHVVDFDADESTTQTRAFGNTEAAVHKLPINRNKRLVKKVTSLS